ncbi:small acid-soluble spore protein (thioredoxin-like protein) [Alteribacillus persepolensis]|uniref:Small, acid-soluble spore protein Tlp n=1 Tax=Alteribacillus persepolensis TaxID=568899 RepID=A0A1G8GER0_9BACI|nr:small acid-soluble spore protein Tlp [Alteribacillus persepolensis]SDH92845.1 small acid-soluble spore protein (thioredoxin-like protein) [Alteribacillus persepolensis]
MHKPKPDDRSNNAERIENNIGHTMQNLNEARDFAKAHADELSETDKRRIEEKNQRRERAIEGMREEIKDEVHDQQHRS